MSCICMLLCFSAENPWQTRAILMPIYSILFFLKHFLFQNQLTLTRSTRLSFNSYIQPFDHHQKSFYLLLYPFDFNWEKQLSRHFDGVSHQGLSIIVRMISMKLLMTFDNRHHWWLVNHNMLSKQPRAAMINISGAVCTTVMSILQQSDIYRFQI